MSYLRPFHRLVIFGTLYSDIFNVTLSLTESAGPGEFGEVTQELADAVLAQVSGWWQLPAQSTVGGGIGISQAAVLMGIKLNRIGTDGRYMDDPVEALRATPRPGGSGVYPAPQLTLAATLRGFSPRDRAGKGRMYFPPADATLLVNPADGRISEVNATNYGLGVRNLLIQITAAYTNSGVYAVAGITSRVGAGAEQPVSEITIGRTVDTMRSRRNKIPEDFVTVDI